VILGIVIPPSFFMKPSRDSIPEYTLNICAA
jgi:hypothetical protein